MKSLKIIQLLTKICRVICLVIFICCIVGASLCFVSLLVLPFTKDVLVLEGKTLSVYLSDQGTNFETAIVGCIVGLITCGVGIFLAKYTEVFFKKELAIGTPFTREIVKDMRKVALVHIIASFATMTLLAIFIAIVRHIYVGVAKFDDLRGGSIGFGLFLLVLSLFFEYGVESKENQNLK